MPIRFYAYPPEGAAMLRLLDDAPVYRIGRDSQADIRIEHASISRLHAQLHCADGGWSLSDAGSKNGVRVNGRAIARTELREPLWCSIGDVYCRFEPLSAAAAAAARAQDETRRSVSRSLSAGLRVELGIEPLLARTLAGVLELSGLERGFVLYGESADALRVRACHALDASDLSGAGFAGSAGAVERALRERRTVVCSDIGAVPWLEARPSVQLAGLRALACIPMLAGQDLIGVVYADSRKPGLPLNELDQALIESVAQQAAAALSAAQLRADMEQLIAASAALGTRAPRWEEIRRAHALGAF